jgi:Rho GTPase-activating protein 1
MLSTLAPVKPQIFPQDHIHRYLDRIGFPGSADANRYSSCRISVCSHPGSGVFFPDQLRENAKHEKQITLPIETRSNLFGVHLEELMGYNGEKGGVPRVVRDCVQYLSQTGAYFFSLLSRASLQLVLQGLTDEGLFRRCPSSAILQHVKEAYDRGQVVSLDSFNNPYLAAVLLKKYLRDLPEPLFLEALYPVIQQCPRPTEDPSDWSAVLYIRETLLPALPRCNYILLSYVLRASHFQLAIEIPTNNRRLDA